MCSSIQEKVGDENNEIIVGIPIIVIDAGICYWVMILLLKTCILKVLCDTVVVCSVDCSISHRYHESSQSTSEFGEAVSL